MGQQRTHRSGERFADDFATHARQALVEPLVEVGEPGVVEAHQMQDCCVQVGNMPWVLDGLEAQLVRRADRLAALHAGTGVSRPDGLRFRSFAPRTAGARQVAPAGTACCAPTFPSDWLRGAALASPTATLT